jgi:hypothetical protein
LAFHWHLENLNTHPSNHNVEKSPQEAIQSFKENMLYEMMSMENNKGKLSSIFIHAMDDWTHETPIVA